MRLLRTSPRAASGSGRRIHSTRSRLGAALIIGGLLVACRGDVATVPIAPTSPLRTLTGGAGTQIFPDVPVGEIQPTGDARALNASAVVTGAAWDLPGNNGGESQPYRWTASGGATRIIVCCGATAGNDINDAGTVVGAAYISANVGIRGFVATGTSGTQLPILPTGDPEANSFAVAINTTGQIAGESPVNGFARHAVLWSSGGGTPQDLGTLGGTSSRAIDINASGQVIGWSQLPGDASSSFFLWSSGAGMQNLATVIGAAVTDVVEINGAGQIIGTYGASNGQSHAFLYTPGSGLRDLGTLGGTSSAPTGLNSRGDVVGISTLADASTHAFLWTAADGMEDITAVTGVTDVRRLNDNLQTLVGANASTSINSGLRGRPRLLQLQVTQSNVAPTALFTVECNGLTCVLDASGSLDDKPGLTYSWDLNKYPGGSATGAKVTVTYPHADPRTITLTVTDANGLTSTLSKTVNVLDTPIGAFIVNCTGLTCTFDASGSTSDVTTYLWRFGDGGTGPDNVVATHTYAQPGTYNVQLEVWAGTIAKRGIITKQVTVTAPAVNQPPVANFTISCPSLTCTFDATGSTDDGGIVSYAWDLNKYPGGSATGSVVTTTYPHSGIRNVTLTVTDAQGLSNSVTKQVDVGTAPTDQPPVAAFTWSCPTTVCTLDASSSTDDNGIALYEWSLDKSPGNYATGVTVTTDYWHTSTRSVTLTVTDTKGQKNSVTKTVQVP